MFSVRVYIRLLDISKHVFVANQNWSCEIVLKWSKNGNIEPRGHFHWAPFLAAKSRLHPWQRNMVKCSIVSCHGMLLKCFDNLNYILKGMRIFIFIFGPPFNPYRGGHFKFQWHPLKSQICIMDWPNLLNFSGYIVYFKIDVFYNLTIVF